MSTLPTLGVMLGDVTGIGPEIAAKVLASGVISDQANLVVIGDARVLDLGIRDAGVTLPYTRYQSIDEVRFPHKDLPLVDLGNVDPAQFRRGEASPDSGRLTGDTLKAMIDLALAGKLDGITFAPLNKGVTVTAGLKTVFTTPAHGTAYDIVGEGKADPGAMEHALKIAAQIASARRSAKSGTPAHAA